MPGRLQKPCQLQSKPFSYLVAVHVGQGHIQQDELHWRVSSHKCLQRLCAATCGCWTAVGWRLNAKFGGGWLGVGGGWVAVGDSWAAVRGCF